ncbi:MAG: conjugal transfer protein, partial [Gammaproteobacteria bacterium]|nr:conjugal transfer protein [Gammaproteobacteria bacterium]
LLDCPNGFTGAAREALTKLGVNWEPTEAELAYNEARSTQIPVNPSVRIVGRFKRRIYDDNRELNIEH